MASTGTPSTPNGDLTPDNRNEIRQEILGTDLNKLNNEEQVKYVVDVLKGTDATFGDCFKKIVETYLIHGDEADKDKRAKEINDKIKAVVLDALRKAKDRLNNMRNSLAVKIDTRKKAIQRDLLRVKATRDAEMKIKSSGKDKAQIDKEIDEFWAPRLEDNKTETDIANHNLLNTLNDLWAFIDSKETPITYLDDIIKTEIDEKDKVEREAARKALTDAAEMAANEKLAEEQKKNPKLRETIPVEKIDTVEKYKKAGEKWKDVVNSFGDAPSDADVYASVDLYWRNLVDPAAGPMEKLEDKDEYGEITDPADTTKKIKLNDGAQKEFVKFYELKNMEKGAKNVLDFALSEDLDIDIKSRSKDSPEVKADVRKKAQEILNKMKGVLVLFTFPAAAEIAMYAAIGEGVGTKPAALAKVVSLIDEKLGKEKEARTETEHPEKMVVQSVSEIKDADDVLRCKSKWDHVVNKLGERPTAADIAIGNLCWKSDIPGAKLIPLGKDKRGKDEKKEFAEFKAFIEGRTVTESIIFGQVKLESSKIDYLPADQFHEKCKAGARKIWEKLEKIKVGTDPERARTPAEMALLLYTLGVKTDHAAFLKLVGLLTESKNPRGTKDVYEVSDKDLHKPIPLGEFLKQPFGAKMISAMYKVMNQLYDDSKGLSKFPGVEAVTKAEFHKLLIEIIKCKGSRPAAPLTQPQAHRLYTLFLIQKDPDIGEKEILQLLIAFIPVKPFVYDLRNDLKGWKLGPKKENLDHEGMKNFIDDGEVYALLEEKLGLEMIELAEFLANTTANFEVIRNAIKHFKNHDKKEVSDITLEEFNDAVPGLNYRKEDWATFKKLVQIPLWSEKIGKAFKHASYRLNEGNIEVPQINHIQGLDTVREIDVVFVGVDEKMKRIARRIAAERIDQELKEMGPQGWLQLWRADKVIKKWWWRNAHKGLMIKYEKEYYDRLKTSPDYRMELMGLNRPQVKPPKGPVPAPGAEVDLNPELDAIAERFGMAWTTGDEASYITGEEDLHDSLPENVALQESMRKLCTDYANTTMTDAQFRARVKSEIIPQVTAMADPPDETIIAFLEESTGRGVPGADKIGLLDKLKAHKAGLIALDLDNLKFNIAYGKAKNVDAKTDVRDLNWFDKHTRRAVDWLQNRNTRAGRFLGRFVSPTTMAVIGYGIGNIVTQVATNKFARYSVLAGLGLMAPGWPAAIGIAAGVITGGLVGWMRQNKEQLYLKAQAERREAFGYEPGDDTKSFGGKYEHRLKAKEKTKGKERMYEKVKVYELIDRINSARTAATAGNTAALQTALARAISRNMEKDIDLIKFTNEKSVERERLELTKAIAAGTSRLRGLEPDAETVLNAATAAEINTIVAEIEKRDKNFNRFKHWENFTRGGAMGGLIGGAASGLISLAAGEQTFTTGSHVENITHGPTVYQTLDATGKPVLDSAGNGIFPFHNALGAAIPGISLKQITDIENVILHDPGWVTNKVLSATAKAQIHALAPGVDVNSILHTIPGTSSTTLLSLPVPGGAPVSQMDLTQLQAAVLAKDPTVNLSLITLDHGTYGHLTPAAQTELAAHNFKIHEIASTSTAPGPLPGPLAPGPVGAGWDTLNKLGIKNINPVHNSPNPTEYIRDELHFETKGAYGPGTDGNYHFTVKSLFNSPASTHSVLPTGVTRPTGPGQIEVLLDVKQGGGTIYKLFPVGKDLSGNPLSDPNELVLPKELFDGLPHNLLKGKAWPGFKVDGLRGGFRDGNGVFQQLNSTRGVGGFEFPPVPPEPTEAFKFAVEHTTTTPDITEGLLTAEKNVTDLGHDYFVPYLATTPFISPMPHLEYGKFGAAGTPGTPGAPLAPGAPASPAAAAAMLPPVTGKRGRGGPRAAAVLGAAAGAPGTPGAPHFAPHAPAGIVPPGPPPKIIVPTPAPVAPVAPVAPITPVVPVAPIAPPVTPPIAPVAPVAPPIVPPVTPPIAPPPTP